MIDIKNGKSVIKFLNWIIDKPKTFNVDNRMKTFSKRKKIVKIDFERLSFPIITDKRYKWLDSWIGQNME